MTANDKTVSGGRIAESKFLKIFMMLLSVLLIFVGSTYIPYAMQSLLNLDFIVTTVTGFVLFLAGVVLLVYLAKQKVIT